MRRKARVAGTRHPCTPGTLALALILLLTSIAWAGPHHPRKSAGPKSLKGRLGSIRQKKQAAQARLHETRVKAQGVQKTIHVVDASLDEVKERLERTTTELGGARREQASVAADLAQTTAELAKAREQARKRLRAMAKGGNANVLAAFAGSSSVGELAEWSDLMRRLAAKDHALFARVRALKAKVSERKRRQDDLVAQVSTLARRQSAQRAELQAVRTRKGQELVGLKQQAADLEASLKQFDDDAAEIARLIRAAEAAARRPRPGHKPVAAFIGRFRRPVNAPITSGFGMRFHPILHRSRLHAGVDFGAASGTPIHCAAPGEVVAATCMRGFGNVVIVDHGGGISTVYGHMSRLGVHAGQRVSQGAVLGNVGATGLATGPHLHWEVHVNGRPVDPMGRL